ncbi:MAG: FAD-binding oxidoreductase [Gaiellaceae bacterium]
MRDADRVEIGASLAADRLDRVLEYEPGDLTCVVEAGIRLSALSARLAEQGQRLSLDPPGDPTLGACVAADLSGPLSHRFGTMRDLLLGITVVLADGTVANSGGKVVKNVAGYDLAKLFCGSQGRLGLIVRVSLRLHPLPAAARSLSVPVPGPAEGRRLLRELRHSQLVPSAADLHVPGRLALLFEGAPRGVEAELHAARELLGGEESDPWDELLAFQAATRGRVPFDGVDGPAPPFLARRDTAYVEHEVDAGWPPLAERVRTALDPGGVLA